jgi:hypothetical protein
MDMVDQQASNERRPIPDNRPVQKPDPGPMFTEPGQVSSSSGEREESGAIVPFESKPINDRLELTDEMTQSVLEAVLKDEAVEKRLSVHRYEALGLVRGDGKKSEEEDRHIVLVIAEYTTNATVKISMTEEYEVANLSESHDHAALSTNELERALELLNETEQFGDPIGKNVCLVESE